LLESFNALKSACNVDPAAESVPLQSLTGHEDFFAEDSPYSLPLAPVAVLVTLPATFSNRSFDCCAVIHFVDFVLLQDVSAVLGAPVAPASNEEAEDGTGE
jgi:hypothetical protein